VVRSDAIDVILVPLPAAEAARTRLPCYIIAPDGCIAAVPPWHDRPMTDVRPLLVDRLPTPIGEMVVVADADGRLRVTDWTDHADRMVRLLDRYHGRGGWSLAPATDPGGLVAAIGAYFSGDLAAIDAIPVAFPGTVFQWAVWTALRAIPCGATVSYGELARRIGRPDAVRAVGLANGANPIGVVVPCHRVIGADGTLTGYGGGLERKRWLLAHEARSGRAQGELAFRAVSR
jgi:methylated-DNA-[protein]-cysteine S-methyltransferase